MRVSRSLLAALLALAALALGAQAATPAAPVLAAAVGPERWTGEASIPVDGGPGGPQALSLRRLSEGFVLVDLPAFDIYGLPAGTEALAGGGFAFTLGGTEGAYRFELGPDGQGGLSGQVRRGGVAGGIKLAVEAPRADKGMPVELAVRGGKLRGSLILPGGEGPRPLALIVSGPGASDRDGNNFQVPGRCDALLQLAQGLAGAGVASLRYDRRGSGESIALAPDESTLRFGDHVEDLRALVAALARDPRFSSILVVGYSEGALVGAVALSAATPAPSAGGAQPSAGPKLALLAAGAASALDAFKAAIESSPPEEVEAGRAILARILEGGTWPEPPPFYAESFRPSFQAYLSSWLPLELRTILPGLGNRILLASGDRDIQLKLPDFLALAALRPEAPALVFPEMNHVLKDVPSEVDANFAAFSDPAWPLAGGLVEALAAFAKGEALPPGPARVDGGVLH